MDSITLNQILTERLDRMVSVFELTIMLMTKIGCHKVHGTKFLAV